jgi:hypothetical protein
MTMDSLGGSLPAARPAVVGVNGKTHVFAIGFDKQLHHWQLAADGSFTGPLPLPIGGWNVPADRNGVAAASWGGRLACSEWTVIS